MVKGPCQDCQERGPGCHSSCEMYKAYKEEREKENKWLRDWKEAENRNQPIRYCKTTGRFKNPDRGINRKERKKAR